jgi:hypothetical protein
VVSTCYHIQCTMVAIMKDDEKAAFEQKINELISPHTNDYSGPTPIYRWMDSESKISVMPHFMVHLPSNVRMKLIMLMEDNKTDEAGKDEL